MSFMSVVKISAGAVKPMDSKVIVWMLKGAPEINDVYRWIDASLLEEAVLPEYQELIKAIYQYYLQYRKPPTIDILIEKNNDNQDIIDALQLIQDEECKSNEIQYQIDQIKERYNKQLNNELKDFIENESNVQESNDYIKKILAKIEQLAKDSILSEGDFKQSIKERYHNYIYNESHPQETSGVPSGYWELDEYTWGLKESEMMVITGASSSGKSLLMLNIGLNAWLGKNKPLEDAPISPGLNVLYFTLEMSKEQLEHRMDSCLAHVKHENLIRGRLSDDEKLRFKKSLEFQKKYTNYFYIVDIPRGSKTLEVEAKYEAILGEFRPDLVCVDYMGIMAPNREQISDWLDLGKVSEELHELCRNKKIPLITAAQRKTKGRNSKEYNDLEDIGRSKMVGDNANIVLLIANRENELLLEDMEIHIVKNRDGRKGKFKLLKIFDESRVSSLPDNWAGNGTEDEI